MSNETREFDMTPRVGDLVHLPEHGWCEVDAVKDPRNALAVVHRIAVPAVPITWHPQDRSLLNTLALRPLEDGTILHHRPGHVGAEVLDPEAPALVTGGATAFASAYLQRKWADAQVVEMHEPDPTVADLRERVKELEAAIAGGQRQYTTDVALVIGQHEADITHIRDALIQWGEDCDMTEAVDVMIEHINDGLSKKMKARVREFAATVTVTVRFSVQAEDKEAAEDKVVDLIGAHYGPGLHLPKVLGARVDTVIINVDEVD